MEKGLMACIPVMPDIVKKEGMPEVLPTCPVSTRLPDGSVCEEAYSACAGLPVDFLFFIKVGHVNKRFADCC